MDDSATGSVTAFFLYDVADAIDLPRVRSLVEATVRSPLTPKVTTPPYIQYQEPPVVVDGRTIGVADHDGFRVRFKMFDYGVVSVALTREMPRGWPALLDEGLRLHDSPALSAAAERFCRTLMQRLAPAVTHPRADYLSEDYLVFAVT